MYNGAITVYVGVGEMLLDILNLDLFLIKLSVRELKTWMKHVLILLLLWKPDQEKEVLGDVYSGLDLGAM